jgi:hypothetical protein
MNTLQRKLSIASKIGIGIVPPADDDDQVVEKRKRRVTYVPSW